MTDAIVLAGAASMGAFTAGALSVLSEPGVQQRQALQIQRVVGVSAGALNGAYYAAAIHAGTVQSAGSQLTELWLDDATFLRTFDVSLGDVVALRGLSNDRKLVARLRQQIRPTKSRQPVELRLVLTNADGETVEIGGQAATTYEHVERFTSADFETQASLERLFVAVAASSALPVAFAPVSIELAGQRAHGLDGGLVNDTPLGHALDGALEIDRVFVVVPFPRVRAPPARLQGLALAARLLDIIVDERLVRDLRYAAHINRVLTRLPSLVPDADMREELLEALSWSGRRPVRIVEIRPEEELAGNGLSGLASRELRQLYVDAGVAAARAALMPPGT
jgi:predicted acylesterase/phospholipase RssA